MVHFDQVLAREGTGRELERSCATTFNLLGFITTVSLTANTHFMTDGLTLAFSDAYKHGH